MADKKDRFELTELFMAQADRDRRFFGSIQRGFDSSGHPVVRGRIEVNTGFVCAMASHQDELGSRLDEIVLMVLDYDIHNITHTSFKMNDNEFVLN